MLPVIMEDYSEPSVVAAFEGSVVLTGPGPISAAFTPDAAEASAHRMLEAASVARAYAASRQVA